MDIISFLRSIDWPSCQVLFAFGYESAEIDACIEMVVSGNVCEESLHLLHTRCLFSTTLASFILNRQETWRRMDIEKLDHSFQTLGDDMGLMAISIEIDVTSDLDHMFTLLYTGPSKESPSGWYIIQSYVMEYSAIIEPINAKELISNIFMWNKYGTDPSIWKKYFHADLDSTNRANPHIYVTDKIHTDDINTALETIKARVQSLINDDRSYINGEKYECILAPYLK